MGKLRFFNKNNERQCNACQTCNNLTDLHECSVIEQIKLLQLNANAISKQIELLEKQCQDSRRITEFLASNGMVSVIQEIYRYQKRSIDIYGYDRQVVLNKHALSDLRKAVCNIPDIDRFCEELKLIYNNESILRDLEKQKREINENILELKNQLGIM